MSLHDYRISTELTGAPFEALIMAALRAADSSNASTLRAAFPELCAEMQARYDAPSGLLATDPNAVETLAALIDPMVFGPGTYAEWFLPERDERRESARRAARERLGLTEGSPA